FLELRRPSVPSRRATLRRHVWGQHLCQARNTPRGSATLWHYVRIVTNHGGGDPCARRSLIGDHELAGDMEPIIAGRDLRKSWGATLVLEHADFLLHAGDKVALVGPNGSGKSTLFRLLAGQPT